jgi:hypothetical protein
MVTLPILLPRSLLRSRAVFCTAVFRSVLSKS